MARIKTYNHMNNNSEITKCYNLPDEEKEILIRFRLLSDEEKQKLIEQLSSQNNNDD